MLSIQWLQDVDYYLDQATADYYFRPGEPPGRWWGLGAKSLGLTATVTAEHLKALCQGFGPDGKALIQNAGAKKHQQAWDLTFSAPKSLSVLWSQVSTATRHRIEKLHERAVDTALRYLTQVALLTRRGKGGKTREQAQPIVAKFPHGSNRSLEPQLHTHAVLLNVAGRADGTFGTILSEPVYRHKMTAGALYQTELAHLLSTELGLKVEKDRTAFRIVGVPQKLIDHYSTRRKEILAKLDSTGHGSAKAAAVAALATRKAKQNFSRGELLKRWQETNRRFGFTEETAQGLIGKYYPVKGRLVTRNHIAKAIETLLKTESFFSAQELIREVIKGAMGCPAAGFIKRVDAYLLNDSEIVALGLVDQEPVFTTREVLAIESQLLATIDNGRHDTSHAIRESIAEKVLDKLLPIHGALSDDDRLRNEEQRRAVIQVTTKPGRDQVIEGMAGTGKTYTLKVAREVWQKAGFDVVGMALSAVAAAKLQKDSGIESTTLAKRLLQLDGRGNYIHHHKRQLKRLIQGERTYAYDGPSFRLSRKTVVVLDEAGMVGTRQMAKLIEHVRRAGAKLVLVGDRRQLQPIEAGGPFAAVADKADKADLQHVVRQKIEPDDPNPKWHREVGKLITAGHAGRAIKLFAERGRLSVLGERSEAILSMVRDWSVKGMASPTSHIVLAGTREDVATLNQMCQSARLSAGLLGADAIKLNEQTLHVGDIVLFTQNARVFGVNNGDRGVVLGFNSLTKTMAVQLDGTGKTAFISYRNYTHVQLGYAMTTHKAQGATVPSVYILLGGAMQDRHLSYVQATRACDSTRLYADQAIGLKYILQQMTRERPKLLAHDVRQPSGSRPSPRPPTPTKKIPGPKPSLATAKPATAPSSPSATGSENRNALTEAIQKRRKLSSQSQVHGRLHDQRQEAPPTINSTIGSAGERIATTASEPQSNHELVSPRVFSTAKDTRVQVGDPSSEKQRAKPMSPRVRVDGQTKSRRRNVQDLSHVRIDPSTDLEILKGAVEHYGRLPGGIVLECEPIFDVPIASIAADSDQPGTLIVNGSLLFDSGLSAEEVALLWHAVFETGEAATNFGAVSQNDVVGLDNETVVATTMMHADNALGQLVYGFDSTFRLAEPSIPGYVNPFVAEAEAAQRRERLDLMTFNHLNRIHPQFFLNISGARFRVARPGVLNTALSVTAPIGVVNEDGTIIASLARFSCNGPLVADRFPWVYRAFMDLNARFSDYAKTDQSIARAIAYAELVLLLRKAKSARAILTGHDYVRACIAKSQRVSIPNYNFTVRDGRYVELAARTARQLSSAVSADPCDVLLAAFVGLEYAARAGDARAFLDSKKTVLASLDRAASIEPRAESPTCHHEISRAIPLIEDNLLNRAHDVLIDNCLGAAFVASCIPEQQEAYLRRALSMCETESASTKHVGTRCRWIEARNHLDQQFDPVRELSNIRTKEPGAIQPFFSLNQMVHRPMGIGVNTTTRDILLAIQQHKWFFDFSTLEPEDAALWSRLEERYTAGQVLWLLQELRRFRVSIEDFLSVYRRNAASRLGKSLAKIVSQRLKPLPNTAFSTFYLHRQNPFVNSHVLLDFETPECLASMFDLVRSHVEAFGKPKSQTGGGLRQILSTILGDGAEGWWRRFLKLSASTPASDASKVAVLLAHELRVRGRSLGQLYEQMQRHGTQNPQAGLFLLDLNDANGASE